MTMHHTMNRNFTPPGKPDDWTEISRDDVYVCEIVAAVPSDRLDAPPGAHLALI